MRTIIPIAWMILSFSVSCQTHTASSSESMMKSPYDLEGETLPTRWDEALPLGNGMVGALVWKKDSMLRLSLDRADVWDLRPVKELREMTFDWVHDQVKKKEYKPVQELGDVPYDRDPFPTKLPIAAIEFDIKALGDVKSSRLSVDEAVAEIQWQSGARMKTFVHATEPVGWFRFENLSEDITPHLVMPAYKNETLNSGQADQSMHGLAKLGYEQGYVEALPNKLVYRQQGTNEMTYIVTVQWENTDNVCEGRWYVTVEYPNNKDLQMQEPAQQEKSYNDALHSHRAWWKQFWQASRIQVPDSLLMRQYYLEMYKFGSVARPGAPPISLQAVWTADNGSLPPWKGDFHHDLNTQLSYWPGYAGNYLELTRSFTDWLWKVRDENKAYTQWYFGVDGLNVPGVTTLTGEPMGGWIQYSLSPTISAWLAQHFYWQWRYSMDENFLKERAYPYIHDVATYLENVTYMEDGIRKLPLSSSPEYNDNRMEAWFTDYTNYDLSLIRFAFTIAAEMANEMGKEEERTRWLKRAAELPSFAIDPAKGLDIATGSPLEHSHRHFSHLMAIHPLGLIDPANGDAHQRIIDNSLKTLEENGTDAWVGYSFSWLASMYARAGNGDKAAEALRIFARNFTSPNSFHLNGDQKGGEYSDFTYRPFTLEGNFAFAAGLQEMLLQSHASAVEIFPAIPEDWREVSFENLRAQGAFLVSAKVQDSHIVYCKIQAEKAGTLRLRIPDSTEVTRIEGLGKARPTTEDGILTATVAAGDVVEVFFERQ